MTTNQANQGTTENTVDIILLRDIIKHLVSYPDEIVINKFYEGEEMLLTVRVNAADMGILIGRNGIMASSIKVVIKAIGKSNGMNLRVQFLEPDGSSRKDRLENSEGNQRDSQRPYGIQHDHPARAEYESRHSNQTIRASGSNSFTQSPGVTAPSPNDQPNVATGSTKLPPVDMDSELDEFIIN